MFGKRKGKDPFDGEYIGNIWGWKMSFIGLGVILFFLLVVLLRQHHTGRSIFDPPPPGSDTTFIKID